MKSAQKSEATLLMDGEDYIHPQLLRTFSRRKALATLGGFAGLAMLTSCAGSSFTTPASNSTSTTDQAATPGTCSVIPSETEGPYPASQVLGQSWIYRQNNTDDRAGVPLQMVLNLFNTNNSCNPISNAAVYLWHCDKDGNYSGYGNSTTATFLRGVQVSSSAGQVTFQTIYPGWYSGRITHIHFEVFLNNNLSSRAAKVSQIAFPQAITQSAYASSLYVGRGQNTSVTSFARDNVFSDGVESQLATVSGDTSGFIAQLNVGLAL